MSQTRQHFSDIVWPDVASYWIGNARVPLSLLAKPDAFTPQDREDGAALLDVLIENGRIARLAPSGSVADQQPRIDLQGRQLWPMLVDMHTHLDRGHTVVRSPNISGGFSDALKATAADRLKWTHDDLIARMGFGLRSAYAHGVSAIRTHLDSVPQQAERSWNAFRDMRAEWKDKIALQAVSLLPIDLFREEWGDKIAKIVAESGGILGAVTRAANAGGHGAPLDDLDALMDRLFGLAARYDLDIDLHVDETSDPRAAALPYVARAAIRHGYQNRVTCGHCCSLAVQPEEQADRTMDLLAEGKVAVVTLPTANLYLQDRGQGRTPRHPRPRDAPPWHRGGRGRRQLPRLFLRLWRPRHDRYVAAGGPRAASRPSAGRGAGAGRSGPGRHRQARGARPHRGGCSGALDRVQRTHAERDHVASSLRSHRDRPRPP